jgi:hypothetical protein
MFAAGLSRLDSSCVSCEPGVAELELGDAWESRKVASFSVTKVSGHKTSY